VVHGAPVGARKTCSSVVSRGVALTASAQVFVVYPFSADVNPSAIGAGVTPRLGLTTLSNAFIGDDGFGNVLEAYPIAGSTSAALALANNSFFTLSLSIAPGTFGPTTVNFNVGRGGSSESSRIPGAEQPGWFRVECADADVTERRQSDPCAAVVQLEPDGPVFGDAPILRLDAGARQQLRLQESSGSWLLDCHAAAAII